MPNPYEEAEPALDSLKDVMEELTLSTPEWPDLTQLFNLNPVPAQNLQQTPSGAATLNPNIYRRPSLTLNPVNTGQMTAQNNLTPAQLALLSPGEQAYYMQRNRNRIT